MRYVILQKSLGEVPPQTGQSESIGVGFSARRGALQKQPQIGKYHAYKTMSSDYKTRMRQRKQTEKKEDAATDEQAGIPPEPKEPKEELI